MIRGGLAARIGRPVVDSRPTRVLRWRMVALRRALVRSRLIAVSLIVLTVLGTSGTWHVDASDPDLAAPIAHDHSTHHAQFGRATTPGAPVHCAICHWLQAFRSDATSYVRVQPASDGPSVRVRAAATSVESADRIDLPSRAPPLA